jgi:hypothetical protein
LDDLYELIHSVAALTRECDELLRARNDGATLGRTCDSHTSPAAKLEQSLATEGSERTQHRVRVDTQDCGEIASGR